MLRRDGRPARRTELRASGALLPAARAELPGGLERRAALRAELPGSDALGALRAGDRARAAGGHALLRDALGLRLRLLARLHRLVELPGEAEPHAEPGARQQRVGAAHAAALRHPLARLHHRVGGGDLLVALD